MLDLPSISSNNMEQSGEVCVSTFFNPNLNEDVDIMDELCEETEKRCELSDSYYDAELYKSCAMVEITLNQSKHQIGGGLKRARSVQEESETTPTKRSRIEEGPSTSSLSSRSSATDKMTMDCEFKYYVVEFEKLPTEEFDKYVCVPRAWVLGHASGEKIGFQYPMEKMSVTNKRIVDGEPPSKEWPMYMETAKYKTDNYTCARQFRSLLEKSYNKIRRKNSRVNAKGNKTPVTKQKTSKESRDHQMSDDDEIESEDEAEKFEEEQSFEKTKSPAKVNRLNSRNDRRSVSGCSKETAEKPSSNTTDPDIIQTINANLQELAREMKRQNENIEKLNQHFEVAREASLVSAVLLKEVAKKLMIDSDRLNIENSVLESKEQAAKQGQMITKRRRSVRIQETQDQSEEPVPTKKQYIRPFSLPPEYYEAKDSKWTLRYREMAPGLEELMKGTGVYIDSIRLSNCKRLARDEKTLARLLLVELFTDQALGTCSLTGARAKAFDPDGTKTRPGLDDRTRNVLLNFVEEYCHEKRWISLDRQSIMNTLRNKMQEIRARYVK